MMHDNQTSDSNAQHTFIKEIETMLSSKDAVSIFVRAWIPDNPQRVLVCVQGLGGHGGYYGELADQVALKGTIVVAPDLRGHGHSAGVRGDIDRFDRFVMDVDVAVRFFGRVRDVVDAVAPAARERHDDQPPSYERTSPSRTSRMRSAIRSRK